MGASYTHESDLTNFGTWVHDFGDRIYRYWVYKRRFTPFEEDKKFSDESLFEDDVAYEGYIKEAIELPDGDVLIGFVNPSMAKEYVDYYKLSEIRLAYSEDDQHDFDDDDDESNDEYDDEDEYLEELFMREWKDEDN